MSMNASRTSIDTIPMLDREAAWRKALSPLRLSCDVAGAPLRQGDAQLTTSPTGVRLALLRSSSQTLQCLGVRRGATATLPIMIAFMTNGTGSVAASGKAIGLAEGDLSILDVQTLWVLELHGDFELLLLEVPRQRLLTRLGRSRVLLPVVLGDTIAADAARAAMRTHAARSDQLLPDDLASTETALIELVAGALLTELKGGDSATQVQAAHFRRVSAEIEAHLGDHELSMSTIAARAKMSSRYLQRLFGRQGETFSDYVRRRRLERCRLDLLAPRCSDQSIAEIAFRWGFRDQAHFSRAFGAAFGASPREFRKASNRSEQTVTHRGRPLLRTVASNPSPALRPTGPGTASRDAVVGETDRSRPTAAPAGAYHHLAVSRATVHWGYLSRSIEPALRIDPDTHVTIETLTQHAFDDHERMIAGDGAAEDVFRWTAEGKSIDRRGAGPMNASVFGRGAGEGFGVHICTGPIFVNGAEPGDVLEIDILDIRPRPCANPTYAGKSFASNASAWWGFQYGDLLHDPVRREVITIFEVDTSAMDFARAVYSYRWTTQTDPFGIAHEIIDYPGIPVDHSRTARRYGALAGIRVPVRPHFGFIGVAPREADMVDTIPPGYFGGNIDNWRAGVGTTIYLPVSVAGALLSVGDGHLAMGDGEINGTGLECSLTGELHIKLLKAGRTEKPFARDLTCPVIETADMWVLQAFSYPNYLKELGRNAQAEIYRRSSLDLALRNAFRITRKFLIEQYGLSEDEAMTLMSLAVDFGITQVADGNWGVHATIRKSMFD